MHRRQHEVRSKENDFWLDALEMLYFHDLAPRAFLDYEEMVDRLDGETVRQLARRYFNRENYIRVVLFPEKYKTLKNK
jgi:zinc protease